MNIAFSRTFFFFLEAILLSVFVDFIFLGPIVPIDRLLFSRKMVSFKNLI